MRHCFMGNPQANLIMEVETCHEGDETECENLDTVLHLTLILLIAMLVDNEWEARICQ